jgi:hypothetical protein
MTAKSRTIDEYLAALNDDKRAALEKTSQDLIRSDQFVALATLACRKVSEGE